LLPALLRRTRHLMPLKIKISPKLRHGGTKLIFK
jgi:hypothetical protein